MSNLTEQQRLDLISGLEYMVNESKAASAKLSYTYSVDRMQRRIRELEERIETLENFIIKLRENIK